ncbi:arylamine N-acetyltransferase family protein [Staphylococcus borealis]|uniref:arylamine N-acetyltransferase family protein n=1 Tax=Staphylococcus borealis TaxID=2742203 RepID=UPI000FF6E022|nr:arylamine N-acetyltransferase [Staphylococcus borealis]MDM7862427.1 arylamine N-acetyltransferase [Staphylococcus borealis]MDM7881239.1 arylamine N-acetyltransferase [Staphylococcus borealis]RIO94730.1 arylamine N-acetyltransferase [Staphylococcus haemolyticus]
MNIQNIERYLHIDASLHQSPTLEALNYYIKQYMLTVPFENINVQNGIPISVEINDLYDKFIIQHRGGFCYEMNHFFGTYLEAKGFTVYRMSATVEQPNGNRSPEGSHMSLVVPIDGVSYVADVGFGDLPLQALPITNTDPTHPVTDITGEFRAISEHDGTYYIQKLENGTWVTRYEARFQPKQVGDFADMIQYNSEHPDSIFVQQLIVTQPQSFGRATMSLQHLTLSKQDHKDKYDVTSDNYRTLLKEYFNLDVKIKPLES